MKSLRFLFALVVIGCASLAAEAQVRFANVFNDHMVLQRGKPLNVWGFAAPGERVTVSFANFFSTLSSLQFQTSNFKPFL